MKMPRLRHNTSFNEAALLMTPYPEMKGTEWAQAAAMPRFMGRKLFRQAWNSLYSAAWKIKIRKYYILYISFCSSSQIEAVGPMYAPVESVYAGSGNGLLIALHPNHYLKQCDLSLIGRPLVVNGEIWIKNNKCANATDIVFCKMSTISFCFKCVA